MNHEEAALISRWEESGGCSSRVTLGGSWVRIAEGGSRAHLSSCSIHSEEGDIPLENYSVVEITMVQLKI
jgi:hypothetical protein